MQLGRQHHLKLKVNQTGLLSTVKSCIKKKKKRICFRIFLGVKSYIYYVFADSDMNVIHVVAKLSYFRQLKYFSKDSLLS